jgi:hypothetical protein
MWIQYVSYILFFLCVVRGAPQLMLRTHRSLKAYCDEDEDEDEQFFYHVLQVMEHQWNEIDRGKPTTRRKTCPSATLSTINLTWTWPGIEPEASVVRGRRLTAWAMARPSYRHSKKHTILLVLYQLSNMSVLHAASSEQTVISSSLYQSDLVSMTRTSIWTSLKVIRC